MAPQPHILALLAPLLLGGCATYGWADRTDGDRSARPVAVRTLNIDADAGINAAVLTRDFVSELQRAGVAAEWTGARRTRDVVQCRVALMRDDAFGLQSAVEVQTTCEVDGVRAARQSGDALIGHTAIDHTAGRKRAAEVATRSSFAAVARELVNYLGEVN